MFSPRNLVVAGLVLVAISLGPAGHGLWWLVGFLWLVPRLGHRCAGQAHRVASRADEVTEPPHRPGPDPSRDRHEAFPDRS